MKELLFLQQITTEGNPLIKIRKELHVLSGTRNPGERNILNESDSRYGARNVEDEEAENKLEPVHHMHQANEHEEYASGAQMCQYPKSFVARKKCIT